MSNETLCDRCGTLINLDDARYFNDYPLCKKCQKAMDLHDCGNSAEDGCDCNKYQEGL